MSAEIEKQSANQVNQLFPNSLNQHLSSENPVLVYKKRKNKLPHNSHSRWWTSDTLPQSSVGSSAPTSASANFQSPGSAGEQICTPPAPLQPSPLPLLSLQGRGAPGWHFLWGGSRDWREAWAVTWSCCLKPFGAQGLNLSSQRLWFCPDSTTAPCWQMLWTSSYSLSPFSD